MITAALAHRKMRGGSAVMLSCRNQPERRSTASWAPPPRAAPSDPYAAIDTIVIAAKSYPLSLPAPPKTWLSTR